MENYFEQRGKITDKQTTPKNLSIIKSLETNICHILVDQDGLEYERAKQDFENQPENILTQEEINALYQGNNS